MSQLVRVRHSHRSPREGAPPCTPEEDLGGAEEVRRAYDRWGTNRSASPADRASESRGYHRGHRMLAGHGGRPHALCVLRDAAAARRAPLPDLQAGLDRQPCRHLDDPTIVGTRSRAGAGFSHADRHRRLGRCPRCGDGSPRGGCRRIDRPRGSRRVFACRAGGRPPGRPRRTGDERRCRRSGGTAGGGCGSCNLSDRPRGSRRAVCRARRRGRGRPPGRPRRTGDGRRCRRSGGTAGGGYCSCNRSDRPRGSRRARLPSTSTRTRTTRRLPENRRRWTPMPRKCNHRRRRLRCCCCGGGDPTLVTPRRRRPAERPTRRPAPQRPAGERAAGLPDPTRPSDRRRLASPRRRRR